MKILAAETWRRQTARHVPAPVCETRAHWVCEPLARSSWCFPPSPACLSPQRQALFLSCWLLPGLHCCPTINATWLYEIRIQFLHATLKSTSVQTCCWETMCACNVFITSLYGGIIAAKLKSTLEYLGIMTHWFWASNFTLILNLSLIR